VETRAASNWTSCNDGGSAQWRSSTTRTTGPSGASPRTKAITASNRRVRAASGSTRTGGSSGRPASSFTSGTICASSSAPLESTRRTLVCSPCSARERTICTHGQYAGGVSPS
jgi:hypothetical protein